uniref:Uncharacterized protein n=1 Tax=Aegilops tauschii subsp. strangulata TaxID=200361 RepID=A0A453DDB6_AEGTS
PQTHPPIRHNPQKKLEKAPPGERRPSPHVVPHHG